MCNNISQRKENYVDISTLQVFKKGKIVHKMADMFSQTIS
jgi:hypothetical protein